MADEKTKPSFNSDDLISKEHFVNKLNNQSKQIQEDCALTEDIEVAGFFEGRTQAGWGSGKIKNGTKFDKGMNLTDIIRKLFQVEYFPTPDPIINSAWITTEFNKDEFIPPTVTYLDGTSIAISTINTGVRILKPLSNIKIAGVVKCPTIKDINQTNKFLGPCGTGFEFGYFDSKIGLEEPDETWKDKNPKTDWINEAKNSINLNKTNYTIKMKLNNISTTETAFEVSHEQVENAKLKNFENSSFTMDKKDAAGKSEADGSAYISYDIKGPTYVGIAPALEDKYVSTNLRHNFLADDEGKIQTKRITGQPSDKIIGDYPNVNDIWKMNFHIVRPFTTNCNPYMDQKTTSPENRDICITRVKKPGTSWGTISQLLDKDKDIFCIWTNKSETPIETELLYDYLNISGQGVDKLYIYVKQGLKEITNPKKLYIKCPNSYIVESINNISSTSKSFDIPIIPESVITDPKEFPYGFNTYTWDQQGQTFYEIAIKKK